MQKIRSHKWDVGIRGCRINGGRINEGRLYLFEKLIEISNLKRSRTDLSEADKFS